MTKFQYKCHYQMKVNIHETNEFEFFFLICTRVDFLS